MTDTGNVAAIYTVTIESDEVNHFRFCAWPIAIVAAVSNQ